MFMEDGARPTCSSSLENFFLQIDFVRVDVIMNDNRRDALIALEAKMTEFGLFLRALRERAGFGLRPFAEMVDIQPSNLSAIEHGRRPPPESPEKLREMAAFLGLVENGADWVKFFDLSKRADGLPADVRQVAQRPLVPVLLRTIDNRQLTDAQLQDLIRHVQEGPRN